MAKLQVEFVKVDFSEINLKPGDILVLRVKGKIPAHAKAALYNNLTQAIGKEIKAVIIDEDMEIGIVRAEKAEVE